MKLATFEKDGQHRIGAILDGNTHLLDLAAAHQAATGTRSPYLADMLALIDGGSEAPRLAPACLAVPVASAGKRKTTRIRQGNRVLRQLLCEVANAACKTHRQFRSKYQALVIRRGHKRSIIAIGHKLLRVVYTVLKEQQPYRDLEIDYEALVVAKNALRWLKALKKYGWLSDRGGLGRGVAGR